MTVTTAVGVMVGYTVGQIILNKIVWRGWVKYRDRKVVVLKWGG